MADRADGSEPTETEAKLRASARAFQEIERLEEMGGWRVVERREVRLRDTYWDTPERALGAAGCTLRVRELNGAAEGELTFKGAVRSFSGRAGRKSETSGSRLERTVKAPAGSGPREWAKLPGGKRLLDDVRKVADGAPLEAGVVLLNPRKELVLRRGRDEAVLSLDDVAIEGEPYRRRYVEIEHRAGAVPALEALVDHVRKRFRLRPARAGKLQAAREWLSRRRL
jgi:inorganic triphosphatase YgiF